MSSHVLLFVKNDKVVDNIYFNGTTKTFWEIELWRNFKKTLDKKKLKFFIKNVGFNPDKQSIGFYKVVDLILHPVCKLYIGETIVRIVRKDHWKKNIATLVFTKEAGWAMDGLEDTNGMIVDSDKEYDYIIYMINDCGESENLAFMGRLIDITQNIDALITIGFFR